MKGIKFLILFSLILFLSFNNLFSFQTEEQNLTIAIPDFIVYYFTSNLSLASLVVIVFQFINDKILKHKANKTWTQILTWILSIILSYAGYYFNIGMFSGLDIYNLIFNGIIVGLISNGIYDLQIVQYILSFIKTNKG